MTKADETRQAASMAPLLHLARDAGDGDVSEAGDSQARERLLTAMAMREAFAAPQRRRSGALAVAFALAAAIVAAIVFLRDPGQLRWSVEGRVVAGDSGFVAPARGGSASLRFSDGSTLALAEGARARVAEVGRNGARVVLEEGRLHVEIVHAPGTAWSIEAGPYTIAVTGTAFDVVWAAAAQALEVRMIEGEVIVRGREAPSGIALRAGQRLTARADGSELRIEGPETTGDQASANPMPSAPPVRGKAAPSVIASPGAAPATNRPLPDLAAPVDPASPSAAPSAPAAPSASSDIASPPPSLAKRVAAGDYAGAIADAEARGIDTVLAAASLADLVALADAARYVGRLDLAQRALGAQRARFAGSREATAAAFLLGRIAEDAQGRAAAAILLYDQYLAEAPGGPFAAEALGRKMVAIRRSQGIEAARAAAEEYLRRYPAGAYAPAAKEIARDP